MQEFFSWFFDGLGTFLIGLLIGGGTGGIIAYKIAVKKVNQKANAKDHSFVFQIGGDQQK